MPKSKVENKEIINAIRNELPKESQDRIPVADGTNDRSVAKALADYPTDKNNFIDTLVNKIGKTMFFSKVFNNPFKMLHRGELPYGKSLEEVFVEMAEYKGWGENFTGSSTEEGDLIRTTKANVKVDYAKENFKYKFKASISDQLLKGAFLDSFGLQSMLTQIVNSLYSSVEYQEYENIKNVLIQEYKKEENGSNLSFGVIPTIGYQENSPMLVSGVVDCQNLAKYIRLYTSKLKFPSTSYNLAGVKTWSNKEDLVLFATPETVADLDVYVLAYAFNVDKADVPVRVIEVDTLGKINGKNVKCLLADKDLIQAYDTVKETNSFYNASQMTTNIFSHNHGIMAFCQFANTVVFTD
ncbi:MAG: hypothetical protein RR623_06445 [Bacilli bacterium]